MRPTLLPYAHQTIEPDDVGTVSDALTADWITQGSLIARFEQALAERGGVWHAVAMASGDANQGDVLRALDKVFAHYAR